MKTKEQYISDIRKLDTGNFIIIGDSDYGVAEIWKIYDTYFLFSIPTFGGQPQFEKTYKLHEILSLVENIINWK